jgi:ABC-type transporter Mla maintaining outer membrane lipid asymmetry ATPase subunit MlaF
MLSNEYAVLEPDGQVRMTSADDNLCLLNINFVMLHEGEILFEGPLQLLHTSTHPYIRSFVK